MFNRILLPLDHSALAECVLPHSIAMARAFESQVTLLHVMETVHGAHWRRAMDPLNWQIRKTEMTTYLHDLGHHLRQAGVRAEMQILEGWGADQVIEFSRANQIPLIILSSHGQSGLSGWNVSSVVQKIVLRACTSIMIVRAYQPATPTVADLRYQRILVPMDGSQRAECILPVATTLARAYDAPIVLVHIVRRPEMPRRTPPPREDVELAERLVARNRTEAEQYMEDLRARLGGNVETRVIVSDHVATTLHELVEQEQFDLVLLSAHGCSGQMRWPHGSVVSSFISYGTTPLFIMQDVLPERPAPTPAEVAARECGRH
ncbi:MAG: universal stress protein [Chloroflexota bacterium]